MVIVPLRMGTVIPIGLNIDTSEFVLKLERRSAFRHQSNFIERGLNVAFEEVYDLVSASVPYL